MALRDGQVERHVAGHDGDGAHVDRRFTHGEHERDRVVGRGVGVDHDAAAGHRRSLAANSGWRRSRRDGSEQRVLAEHLRCGHDGQRRGQRRQIADRPRRPRHGTSARASATRDSRVDGRTRTARGPRRSSRRPEPPRPGDRPPSCRRSSAPITRTIGVAPTTSVSTGSFGLLRRSSTAALGLRRRRVQRAGVEHDASHSDLAQEAVDGAVRRATVEEPRVSQLDHPPIPHGKSRRRTSAASAPTRVRTTAGAAVAPGRFVRREVRSRRGTRRATRDGVLPSQAKLVRDGPRNLEREPEVDRRLLDPAGNGALRRHGVEGRVALDGVAPACVLLQLAAPVPGRQEPADPRRMRPHRTSDPKHRHEPDPPQTNESMASRCSQTGASTPFTRAGPTGSNVAVLGSRPATTLSETTSSPGPARSTIRAATLTGVTDDVIATSDHLAAVHAHPNPEREATIRAGVVDGTQDRRRGGESRIRIREPEHEPVADLLHESTTRVDQCTTCDGGLRVEHLHGRGVAATVGELGEADQIGEQDGVRRREHARGHRSATTTRPLPDRATTVQSCSCVAAATSASVETTSGRTPLGYETSTRPETVSASTS